MCTTSVFGDLGTTQEGAVMELKSRQQVLVQKVLSHMQTRTLGEVVSTRVALNDLVSFLQSLRLKERKKERLTTLIHQLEDAIAEEGTGRRFVARAAGSSPK